MRRTFALMILVSSCMIVMNCFRTMPMHDPIYPTKGADIVYSLDVWAYNGVANVKLYERVYSLDASGSISFGAEMLIHEWDPPGTPNSTTLEYKKVGGYAANSLIRYRFLVKDKLGNTRSHHVIFAIDPFPFTAHPAPVYVQGDINHVFDVVFIPDTDITDMAVFRSHCRSMILDAIFAENTIDHWWNRQFNFFINPDRGTATDANRISQDGLHQKPANWANLSFAEVKVIMHQNDLRDYAYGKLFSTEQQNRGTMMHEAGHAMFHLADEYPGGSHWQEAILPNNWATLQAAQADAPSRHKTAADAVEIGTDGWYKICDDNCQMKLSGLNLSHYDLPCGDRVIYCIIDNATNP
ncbi:MAG: hypothetical protein JSW49_08260 [candidate division WOR-3 bacterium]|nr:MAG: hypothetical protein JSW49_08260 [candidate division WOR-3 bacterium]